MISRLFPPYDTASVASAPIFRWRQEQDDGDEAQGGIARQHQTKI
jgi:hypothetical protein